MSLTHGNGWLRVNWCGVLAVSTQAAALIRCEEMRLRAHFSWWHNDFAGLCGILVASTEQTVHRWEERPHTSERFIEMSMVEKGY